MNKDSLLQALLGLFLPVSLTIGILGMGFVGLAYVAVKPRTKGFLAFLLAFGFLGGVTGLIAGVSRESVVGALLTGLLGLMSGLLSYLFGKESLKAWHPYIPYALMLLVISALAGLSLGGIYKKQHEEFDRSYKKHLMEYEKVYLEVLKEERLLKVREAHKAAITPVEPIKTK